MRIFKRSLFRQPFSALFGNTFFSMAFRRIKQVVSFLFRPVATWVSMTLSMYRSVLIRFFVQLSVRSKLKPPLEAETNYQLWQRIRTQSPRRLGLSKGDYERLLYPYLVRAPVSRVRYFVYVVTVVLLYLGYVSARAQHVYAQQVAYNATMESVKETLIPALVSLVITPVDPMSVTVTPSPVPSPTSLPTQGAWIETPVSTPSLHIYRLSWYDPDIGRIYPDVASINCHNWDYDAGLCRSTLSNGDDYHAWYGRALACPSEYPIGTIFRVYLPVGLARDWVCLDRGGAITGDILDFLLRYPDQVPWGPDINSTPWLSPVVVEVFYP